jgi:hypothetical protein
MNFNKSFVEIFNFCEYYNSLKSAINAADNVAAGIKPAQKFIAVHLEALLENNNLSKLYKVEISKGQPSLPRIPWISIVRRDRHVYNCISVSICFGRAGNGVVVGLMRPVESDCFNIKTVDRIVTSDFIDLNSNKAVTSYNSRFINPVELRRNEISQIKIEKLIMDSISMEQAYMVDSQYI